MSICSITGCRKTATTRGWCPMHYQRWRHNGDPLVIRTNQGRGLAWRLWSKVAFGDGCWEWTATRNHGGYGLFWITDRECRNAHRVAYEMAIGPIPEGRQLDHLCGNRACVNPDHLEPVTPQTNNWRSASPSARNARKTHCVNGHAFRPETTYFYGAARMCAVCVKERGSRYYAHKKLKKVPSNG